MSGRTKPAAKRDLRAEFNRFARKAIKDFPELDGKLLIIDRENYGRTFGNMPDGEDKSYFTGSTIYHASIKPPEGHHRAAATMGLMKDDKSVARIILVDSFSRTKRSMSSLQRKWIEEIRGVIDHELGHLVAPGGYKGGNSRFKETVADLFMHMRRMQRLGTADIDDDLRINMWARTAHMLLNARSSHYSVPGVRILMEMNDREKILSLSPADTANAACRMAEMSVTGRVDYTAHFRNIRNAEDGFAGKIRAVADAMVSEKRPLHPDAQHMCADFLLPILNGDDKVTAAQFDNNSLKEIDFTTPYWDDIREKISSLLQEQIPVNPGNARNFSGLMQSCKNERNSLYALGHFDAKNRGVYIDASTYTAFENVIGRRTTEIIYSLIRHMQENKGALRIDTAPILDNPFGTDSENYILSQAKKGLAGAVGHLQQLQSDGTIEFLSPAETARYAVMLSRVNEVIRPATKPALVTGQRY